jgi:hypothetical protein
MTTTTTTTKANAGILHFVQDDDFKTAATQKLRQHKMANKRRRGKTDAGGLWDSGYGGGFVGLEEA